MELNREAAGRFVRAAKHEKCFSLLQWNPTECRQLQILWTINQFHVNRLDLLLMLLCFPGEVNDGSMKKKWRGDYREAAFALHM